MFNGFKFNTPKKASLTGDVAQDASSGYASPRLAASTALPVGQVTSAHVGSPAPSPFSYGRHVAHDSPVSKLSAATQPPVNASSSFRQAPFIASEHQSSPYGQHAQLAHSQQLHQLPASTPPQPSAFGHNASHLLNGSSSTRIQHHQSPLQPATTSMFGPKAVDSSRGGGGGGPATGLGGVVGSGVHTNTSPHAPSRANLFGLPHPVPQTAAGAAQNRAHFNPGTTPTASPFDTSLGASGFTSSHSNMSAASPKQQQQQQQLNPSTPLTTVDHLTSGLLDPLAAGLGPGHKGLSSQAMGVSSQAMGSAVDERIEYELKFGSTRKPGG